MTVLVNHVSFSSIDKRYRQKLEVTLGVEFGARKIDFFQLSSLVVISLQNGQIITSKFSFDKSLSINFYLAVSVYCWTVLHSSQFTDYASPIKQYFEHPEHLIYPGIS